MKIDFFKYHGTGNDFILIDNRLQLFPKKSEYINQLCNRRFGIGADGLILLESSNNYDFKMVYFNADGNEGTMCGNGGRCIVALAKKLSIIDDKTTFEAIDGLHNATIKNDVVKLQMVDVNKVEDYKNHQFLDTGSPHHVEMVNNLTTFDVYNNGKRIRKGAPYFKEGCNVNFVEKIDKNHFKVRTYERGVEDETLACGTGVTAVAIAMHTAKETNANTVFIEALGGNLEINFNHKNGIYTDVFLKGKATFVFKGEIIL